MKSERKIKQAYNQGLQVGYQAGVSKSLEKFTEITIATLRFEYGWSEDQL